MLMLEAGAMAAAIDSADGLHVRLRRQPLDGLVNTAQVRLVDASTRMAMARSPSVVVTSDDYARHSRVWDSIRGR